MLRKVSERTLVLSPHSDDVVMSAFGILTKKLLPEPVRLLTVFSWSNYIVLSRRTFFDLRTLASALPRPSELAQALTRSGGHRGMDLDLVLKDLLDLREPYKISRIRLLEDVSFTKKVGVGFDYFNFPDSKIRHGNKILDPDWPIEREQGTLSRVLRSIKNVISNMKLEAIVAPWPYGVRQHVDHRLVNETAISLSEDEGIRLFYVDDQPYSRRPLKRTLDGRGCSYVPSVVNLDGSEMRSKYRAMGIYRSQMTAGYFRAVDRPPPGSPEQAFSETLWRPS